MAMLAWPFLVTRGKAVGYTAVVAPPQFAERRAQRDLLAAAALGGPQPAGSAYAVEVGGSQTVVFQPRMATEGLLGMPGDKQLTDRQGRQVKVVIGLLVDRGADEVRQTGIALADFEVAHLSVMPDFQRIWEAAEELAPRICEPFELCIPAPEPQLTLLTRPESPPARHDTSTVQRRNTAYGVGGARLVINSLLSVAILTVIVAAVFAVVRLTKPPSGPPIASATSIAPSPPSLEQSVCHALGQATPEEAMKTLHQALPKLADAQAGQLAGHTGKIKSCSLTLPSLKLTLIDGTSVEYLLSPAQDKLEIVPSPTTPVASPSQATQSG